MSYNKRECRWTDHASQWLRGTFVTDDTKRIAFLVSARSSGKSLLGERYNSLLPRSLSPNISSYHTVF